MFKRIGFFSSSFLCLITANSMAVDTFTDQEIKNIYETYISCNFTDEYKNRYVPLPLDKNTLPWNWGNKDVPRIFALLEFERFVIKNNISSNNALSINGGDDPEWYYLPHKQITYWSYPSDPVKYDLHTVNLDEKNYDFVMLNQVLEHVYDPIRCLKNINQHMSPEGILYLSVPANSIPHETPWHFYTGYTPTGVAVLLRLAGFDILSIGQWGNSEYLNKTQSSQNWPDYTYSQNPGFNDFNNPVIIWAFAVKPK